jgi:branched-subunit amino acid aminotransferase/4-amino-4-deoxychorismate lyase
MSVWQLPAWIDGRLTTAGAPAVALSDVGLRSGLGVFETLRIEDARILGLAEHLERLRSGVARVLPDIDATVAATLPATVTHALAELVAAARAGTAADLVARVTLTGGALAASANWPPRVASTPTIGITLHVAPTLPLPPATAVLVAGRRWPADVKSTSYLASVLATREAQARGADVGVLHDGDELLEGAEGNLLLLRAGGIVTPPADGRILPGVTRALLLEVARTAGLHVEERAILRSEVASADALITTSAVQRIRVLERLEDTLLPGDEPTVTLLREALAARAAASTPLPLEAADASTQSVT